MYGQRVGIVFPVSRKRRAKATRMRNRTIEKQPAASATEFLDQHSCMDGAVDWSGITGLFRFVFCVNVFASM